MSKLNGYLSYKDWCILKHSLDKTLEHKKMILFVDTITTTNNLSIEEREALKKEITEETKTFERITRLHNGFKQYIIGNKNYYSSEGREV